MGHFSLNQRLAIGYGHCASRWSRRRGATWICWNAHGMDFLTMQRFVAAAGPAILGFIFESIIIRG